MNEIVHKPVLLEEVCSSIPDSAQFIVDGTLGHGGHTLAILNKGLIKEGGQILGLDVDERMLNKAKKRLISYGNLVSYVHGSYKDIVKLLDGQKADYILLDIGVNLEHFKAGARGFSIKLDADLDMRFNQKQDLSAYTIVNTYSKIELERVFVDYAEFRQPKLGEIIQVIYHQRKINPILTTHHLKEVLNSCGLGEKACAVIFQALRIEVNQELQNLKTFLEDFPQVLASGGRCAIMSYHSLEDRMVKVVFKKLASTSEFTLINKKVIAPHYTEVQKNKAARSAKLRIIEKV